MPKVFYGHDVCDSINQNLGPLRNNQTTVSALDSIRAQRFVDCAELLAGTGDASSLVLTFDDGYRSNLHTLLPWLEANDIPATIFVTSGSVDNSFIPFEYHLQHLVRSADSLVWHGESLASRTQEEQRASYKLMRKEIKPLSHHARAAAIAQLYVSNSVSELQHPPLPFLSTAELRILATHPLITIGAHGRYHVPLTSQSPIELYHELYGAKQTLERLIEQPIRYLSYPYGANNIMIRAAARLAGYEAAFSTAERDVTTINRDRFRIPRYDLNQFLQRERQ